MALGKQQQIQSRRCILCICLVLLSGCVSPNARDMLRSQEAGQVSMGQGFVGQRFVTSHFVLWGLLRPARAGNAALHVYIEGDGYAWRSRTAPSLDPTPTTPTALHLASADTTGAAVLYLARPCQYVTGADRQGCLPKYWMNERFSPVVVESLQEAVTQAKYHTGAQRIALIGYSGGGGLAVLLASGREDVLFLGSVAGTLDHSAWTRLHKVSPLKGSLNALDVVERTKHLPQRHLASEDDTVMPPATQEAYCARLPMAACPRVRGVKHTDRWERVWEYRYGPNE